MPLICLESQFLVSHAHVFHTLPKLYLQLVLWPARVLVTSYCGGKAPCATELYVLTGFSSWATTEAHSIAEALIAVEHCVRSGDIRGTLDLTPCRLEDRITRHHLIRAGKALLASL
jgi:hypothetical protein